MLLIAILLVAESFAVFHLLNGNEDNFSVSITIHIIASVLFGVITGVHRKSIFSGMLTAVVIAMTPLIGVLTMTLLDYKFNRLYQQKSSSNTGGFRVGNPFISAEGNVELPEIDSVVSNVTPAMRRVLQVEYELSESEVNSLSYTRQFELLPLLEKISATSSGDGRLLAQAAIKEIQNRTTVWCANLHRMQLHQSPIPEALERLAVNTYIAIKKQGRNPQSYGLPEGAELIALLETRLNENPTVVVVEQLFELLMLEGQDEHAAQVLTAYKDLPGLNFTYLAAKFRSSRGEWTELVKLAPNFDSLPDAENTSGSRRFWAVDRSSTPTTNAT